MKLNFLALLSRLLAERAPFEKKELPLLSPLYISIYFINSKKLPQINVRIVIWFYDDFFTIFFS